METPEIKRDIVPGFGFPVFLLAWIVDSEKARFLTPLIVVKNLTPKLQRFLLRKFIEITFE